MRWCAFPVQTDQAQAAPTGVAREGPTPYLKPLQSSLPQKCPHFVFHFVFRGTDGEPQAAKSLGEQTQEAAWCWLFCCVRSQNSSRITMPCTSLFCGVFFLVADWITTTTTVRVQGEERISDEEALLLMRYMVKIGETLSMSRAVKIAHVELRFRRVYVSAIVRGQT